MSNWTAITQDDVEAYVAADYIAAAQTFSVGAADPVTEAIADAVATVRTAVSTGNALDTDPTKVPNSLKGLAARRAAFALLARAQVNLSEDQRDERKNDQSRLNRISDDKIQVEKPDSAGPTEVQPGPSVDVIGASRQQTARRRTEGL